jgi:prophage regulatory protein
MGNKMDQDHEASVPPNVSSATSPPPRFLRLKEVCKVTGLGRSFTYHLQATNRFPHSVKIGVRAVGWLEHEVRRWVAGRIAESRPDKPDLS